MTNSPDDSQLQRALGMLPREMVDALGQPVPRPDQALQAFGLTGSWRHRLAIVVAGSAAAAPVAWLLYDGLVALAAAGVVMMLLSFALLPKVAEDFKEEQFVRSRYRSSPLRPTRTGRTPASPQAA